MEYEDGRWLSLVFKEQYHMVNTLPNKFLEHHKHNNNESNQLIIVFEISLIWSWAYNNPIYLRRYLAYERYTLFSFYPL